MTEQKPFAWAYTREWGEVLSRHDPNARADGILRRDVRPLYEHPPTPAAPVTPPEVEAARRKALGAIFAALAEHPWACDTCIVAPLGMKRAITYGVLRDLVGQPRKYPDRAIRGYDDTPVGRVPEKGPERPVPQSLYFSHAHMSNASPYGVVVEQTQSQMAGGAPISVQSLAEVMASGSDDSQYKSSYWAALSPATRQTWLERAKDTHRFIYDRGA